MPNKIKQFIYVSGPPCAGKSKISRELVKEVKNFQYILGDDYWISNDQCDFNTRSKKTNQDILSSVNTITSNSILLEWVPCYGPFVDSLKGICTAKDYEFIHIIIYAPREILEKRKLNRDGNMDLGPLNIEKYQNLNNVTLFDTSLESLSSIVSKCVNMLKQ